MKQSEAGLINRRKSWKSDQDLWFTEYSKMKDSDFPLDFTTTKKEVKCDE